MINALAFSSEMHGFRRTDKVVETTARFVHKFLASKSKTIALLPKFLRYFAPEPLFSKTFIATAEPKCCVKPKTFGALV